VWCFVNAPWQSGLINGIGGFLWGGFGLANFNLLLKMLPEAERQEGAALYQALVMASTVLGPVIGAEIVEKYGFRAVFAASGVLRYLAVAVLWLFVVRALWKPEWRNGK
jgi:MFS family permease